MLLLYKILLLFKFTIDLRVQGDRLSILKIVYLLLSSFTDFSLRTLSVSNNSNQNYGIEKENKKTCKDTFLLSIWYGVSRERFKVTVNLFIFCKFYTRFPKLWSNNDIFQTNFSHVFLIEPLVKCVQNLQLLFCFSFCLVLI